MSDLIERSEVLKQLRLNHKDVVYIDKNECARRIEAIPSAGPTWTDVLAELHERFNALEKELRKASAEMSAIIREYVDRPQGEWIDGHGNHVPMTEHSAYCSHCGEWSEYLTDYCGNCGASMTEREDK